MSSVPATSNVRDNHTRGSVADFLRQQLKLGANLDLVTAYFTVFAYDKLRTDRQTEHGASLRAYSRLLANSVESITATFQKRLASGLQHGRQFILPTIDEQPQPDSDFELVTWLVILTPEGSG